MRVLKNIMPKYIDAHCHTENIPAISAIVNSAKIADWGRVSELSKNGPYGAIGVHPWYVSDLPNNWGRLLEKYLLENPQLMVGEIGLDKHKPNMDFQMSVFEHQLKIAHKSWDNLALCWCLGTYCVYITQIPGRIAAIYFGAWLYRACIADAKICRCIQYVFFIWFT